jgi:hypothetical protein
MPTRYEHLFFPTVHVHDGSLPATAYFDHVLYAQGIWTGTAWLLGGRLGDHVDPVRAAGLIDPDKRVASIRFVGMRHNLDYWANPESGILPYQNPSGS